MWPPAQLPAGDRQSFGLAGFITTEDDARRREEYENSRQLQASLAAEKGRHAVQQHNSIRAEAERQRRAQDDLYNQQLNALRADVATKQRLLDQAVQQQQAALEATAAQERAQQNALLWQLTAQRQIQTNEHALLQQRRQMVEQRQQGELQFAQQVHRRQERASASASAIDFGFRPPPTAEDQWFGEVGAARRVAMKLPELPVDQWVAPPRLSSCAYQSSSPLASGACQSSSPYEMYRASTLAQPATSGFRPGEAGALTAIGDAGRADFIPSAGSGQRPSSASRIQPTPVSAPAVVCRQSDSGPLPEQRVPHSGKRPDSGLQLERRSSHTSNASRVGSPPSLSRAQPSDRKRQAHSTDVSPGGHPATVHDDPRGVAAIHLLVDGMFDFDTSGASLRPYVKIWVGDKMEKTSVAESGPGPIWRSNNEFRFDPCDQDRKLALDVFNKCRGRADQKLGSVAVDLQALRPDTWHRLREPLADGDVGKLEFRICVMSGARELQGPPPPSWDAPRDDLAESYDNMGSAPEPYEGDQLPRSVSQSSVRPQSVKSGASANASSPERPRLLSSISQNGGAPQSSGRSDDWSDEPPGRAHSQPFSRERTQQSLPPSQCSDPRLDGGSRLGGRRGDSFGSGGCGSGGAVDDGKLEAFFSAELQQLSDMGFTDRTACLRALEQADGRVDAALELLAEP